MALAFRPDKCPIHQSNPSNARKTFFDFITVRLTRSGATLALLWLFKYNICGSAQFGRIRPIWAWTPVDQYT